MAKTVVLIVGWLAAILLAFVLTIVLAFVTWDMYTDKVKDERQKIVDTYPLEIEKRLEEKYCRKFVVNPRYFIDNGSPIPFSSNYAPYEYVVKEDGEDGYEFRAWAYPESLKDKQIKEIRDNYYWKSIEKQTKEYIEENMKDLLPEKYKIIFLANSWEELGEVDLSLPLETYCRTLQYQLGIRIWIVTPPKDEILDEQMTKENVYPIINGFYEKNYGKVWLKFWYNHAASDEDYEQLDIEEFEASVSQRGDEYRQISDSLNLSEGLEIEIE